MSKLLWISAVSLVAVSLQVTDASAGLGPVRSASSKANGVFAGSPHGTMYHAATVYAVPAAGVNVPAPGDGSYRSFSYEPGATAPAPAMNYYVPAHRPSQPSYLHGNHKLLGNFAK